MRRGKTAYAETLPYVVNVFNAPRRRRMAKVRVSADIKHPQWAIGTRYGEQET
jgi:hypothetical protein